MSWNAGAYGYSVEKLAGIFLLCSARSVYAGFVVARSQRSTRIRRTSGCNASFQLNAIRASSPSLRLLSATRSASHWVMVSRFHETFCALVWFLRREQTVQSSLRDEIIARVLSAKFHACGPYVAHGGKKWVTPDHYVRCDSNCEESGYSGINPTTGTSIVLVCFSGDRDNPVLTALAPDNV